MTDITSNQRGTNMRILLSILIAITPMTGFAQQRTKNKVVALNRGEGAVIYENYSTNQSFDENTVTATPSGASTVTINTSAPIYGKGSLRWAPTAINETVTIRSEVFAPGTSGQNCQSKFTYKLPYLAGVEDEAGRLTVQVKNQAGTFISALTTLPATFEASATEKSRDVIVFYPCPYDGVTPANSYIDLVITNAKAFTSASFFDEMKHTIALDLGAGVPNNVFSAKVSAAGVVSDENQDFINGNCSLSTSTFTCTFVSGVFPNLSPICDLTPIDASNTIGIRINSTTTGSIVAFTWTEANPNVAAPYAFNISCTKAGTDFIQPAITPNQWNYDWVPLPSVAAGTLYKAVTANPTFGTVAVNTGFHRRRGRNLEVMLNFRSTSAGTSGTGAYLVDPLTQLGLQADPNLVVTSTGVAVDTPSYVATSVGDGSLLAPGTLGAQLEAKMYNLTTVKLVLWPDASASTQWWTSGSAGTFASPNFTVNMYLKIPIQGWTENQNAPQLLGSVTSNATSALRFESAYIANNGTCSVTTTTSAFLTSPTHPGTGRCNFAFVAGTWSAIPHCVLTPVAASANTRMIAINTLTTSAIEWTRAIPGSNEDGDQILMCFGPR